MTNDPTIDGVSRELLERLLTDACNENWSDLNELLHSPNACRCRRFGKDNPHWPCPVHSAQGDQRDPTAAMTEAGCQAYMDADGMIGIMHNSSMGHAYVAMRALDPEVAALQSTIARLEARITQLESEKEFAAATYQAARDRLAELESGRGEPVAWMYKREGGEVLGQLVQMESDNLKCIRLGECHDDGTRYMWPREDYIEWKPLFTAPPAPVAVDERAEFVAWVRREWPQAPLSYVRDLLPKDDPRYGEYCDETLQRAWVGWQARACLDATAALNNKPSTEEKP